MPFDIISAPDALIALSAIGIATIAIVGSIMRVHKGAREVFASTRYEMPVSADANAESNTDEGPRGLNLQDAERTFVQLASVHASNSESELICLVHLYSIVDRGDGPKAEPSSVLLSVELLLDRIRSVPAERPIDVLLHQVDWDFSDLKQVARALNDHSGKVTIYIPYYAKGYAALFCLVADELVMSPQAHLSFCDSSNKDRLTAAKRKGVRNLSDIELLRLFESEQELREVSDFCCELLHAGIHGKACSQGFRIASGELSGSGAATAKQMAQFKIPVSTSMPAIMYDIVKAGEAYLKFVPAKITAEPAPEKDEVRLVPICADACPAGSLRTLLQKFESINKGPVINVIHRSAPASSSVDHLTATAVLAALSSLDPEQSVGLILHTPGGNATEGMQIARALKAHRGHKTVYIPFHAYSAGTLIALAADEIILGAHATLGPIDKQLTISFPPPDRPSQFAAAAYVSVLKAKPPRKISDRVLQTALRMKSETGKDLALAMELMAGTYPPRQARNIADFLCSGRVRHGYPLMHKEAKALGLRVSDNLPAVAAEIVLEFEDASSSLCSVFLCSSN